MILKYLLNIIDIGLKKRAMCNFAICSHKSICAPVHSIIVEVVSFPASKKWLKITENQWKVIYHFLPIFITSLSLFAHFHH